VTTEDFDFVFRDTKVNLRKLRLVADDLDAEIFQPFYTVSSMYRMQNDFGLQIDFLPKIAGFRSFESVRAHAEVVRIADYDLTVASLSDIIKSKRAAGRPKDEAVLPMLEAARHEQEKNR
jgi:hypothetical protein